MLQLGKGWVFIYCINQWVDEKAESEDMSNGDYDYDCVIEYSRGGGGTLEWVCAAGEWGERGS